MQLAALLVEIRRRARVLTPPHVNPLHAIYRRCAALPDSPERQTLERLALAIAQSSGGDIDEEEVWKLDQEALGLLDALIERRFVLANGGRR